MINPELQRFVETSLANHLDAATIRHALLAAGWQQKDIDEALDVVQTAHATAATAGTTAATTTTTATPAVAAAQPTTATTAVKTSGGGRKGLFAAAGVVVVLVLLGGGAAFAYYNNYWPFAGMPDAQLLTNLPTALANINSAAYNLTLDFDSKPREAGVTPFTITDYYSTPQAEYDRDTERLSEIGIIQNDLAERLYDAKAYPTALTSLGLSAASTTDPLTGAPYAYTLGANRRSYTITMTFETAEAISAVNAQQVYSKQPLFTINGQTVTVSNTSSLYAYPITPQLPGPFAYLQYIGEGFAGLPSDLTLHATVGGSSASAAAAAATDTNASFHAGVDYSAADFSMSVDADFLKADSNFYFRINKFPDLFFDLGSLKGQWVAITPADFSSSTEEGFGLDPASLQNFVSSTQSSNANYLTQVRTLYTLAYQDGVLAPSAPAVTEKLNGVNARHFHLTLVQDKLADFYASAATALQSQYGDKAILKFNQQDADYIATPVFGKLFTYLQSNSSFDLWLDPSNGQIMQVSYSLRLVPPTAIVKLQNVEYVLQSTLDVTNVNQLQTISAPTSSISLKDAENILYGGTGAPADY